MRIALVLVMFLFVACAPDENAPRQLVPLPAVPTFTLFVSNQNPQLDPVTIDVSLDGQPAVTGTFAWEDAHNWYAFDFDLAPGDHLATVSTDTGAVLDRTFTMDDRKWAIADFWFGSPALTFDLRDEAPTFH